MSIHTVLSVLATYELNQKSACIQLLYLNLATVGTICGASHKTCHAHAQQTENNSYINRMPESNNTLLRARSSTTRVLYELVV